MQYQMLIPGPVLMIPILMMTTKGYTQNNDSRIPSDVIVTYSNHADVSHEVKKTEITENTTSASTTPHVLLKQEQKSAEIEKNYKIITKNPKKESFEEEPQQEDVVFIPNERTDNSKIRNEVYLQNDRASLGDLMGGHRTVEELLAAKEVRLETEAPVSDIFFVVGKNNENQDKTNPDKGSQDTRLDGSGHDATTRAPKLKCNKLNCNNAIKSVCGEKFDENHQQRFRLFLNECYFRKVNCNFRNSENRFTQVALEKCKTVAAHSQVPFSFSFKPALKVDISQYNDTRRATNSRRSMTMNLHGQFCSHPCPVSCPELYEPECAVSSTGRHRVFVNHCALDHNSCSFGIVWHSVPLSQCVGGKKAEVRQNAGFISWMQRVGVVDKRGRLAYDLH